MKVPIIILAFLGLICGKPLPTDRLQDDLNDFLVYVPTDKILEIALDYLANDPEVKEFIVYIQSEEFSKIHTVVEYVKEYKDCFKFINDQGVDVYAIINEIYDILERHPFQPTNTTRTGVGIYGLIDDVVAVIPFNDWMALFDKKMETSKDFKTLVTLIHSPVFMNMVNTVRTWPGYHKLLEILQEKVVEVNRIIELLGEISWQGTHSLQDDLNDFMAIFPTDKVLEIAMDYLSNDQEVKEFFVYIQSEEFPKIHTIVEYLKEYKYCFKFINDHGVDVYAIVKEIHDILERHPFQPTNTKRKGVGIYGLIDDVIAVLPINELKALFVKKMETSKDFKTLVTAIQSPVFMNIVDTVRAWPENRKLLESLRRKGVDVDLIIEYLSALFGLSWRGTHRLQDDLKEFMALVPTDKVLEIALDYLANDQEVRELVLYIQSEEFPKIHTVVEHLKEYKDCFKFITDQGVDVYAIMNQIHDILERHTFQPINTTRMGVGIYGLIDDVFAVLPLDDMKALFEKKMETRKYFKTLDTALNSPVFVNMVDTVRNVPEYHELLEILREKVVDVDCIIELLIKLSWRGTHNLKDDLKEFMALVPTDKVIQITLDYLANDPKFHEIFAYIQSEEFPKIHKIFEYLKEYKYCLKFISEQGVDVYAFIVEIHDILGLPPFEPTNTTRMGVGIYGLIDDVVAALPLDDLKALFDKKMETRKYFKTLVTALKSPVFVNMVDTVRALPEYKKLLETLRETGVDVVCIIEHFRVLLGLCPI